MFKKSKTILALTLTFALSLSLLPKISLAADTLPTATQAAITKVVRLPIGTTPPTYDFKFNVKPISINGVEDLKVDMPTIRDANPVNLYGTTGVVTIKYPETAVVVKPCACTTVTAQQCKDDVEHYYLESAHLFPSSTAWKYAGIYLYEITETEDTGYKNNKDGKTMTFSKANYTVKVFVSANSPGTGYKIDGIAAYRVKTDDNAVITPSPVKVDPTPNPGNGVFSQMRFTNTYYKHNGGDGKDPINKQTLVIEKKVEGDFALKNKYFEFKIYVTQHGLIPIDLNAHHNYTAYILDTDGSLLYHVDNKNFQTIYKPTTEAYYSSIKFTGSDPTGEMIFRLKHGQKLVFTDMHVGVSYTITEYGVDGYTASATVTTAGATAPPPYASGTGGKGEGLSIPSGENAPTLRIGDIPGKNEVLVINNYDAEPETGLNISNLPFYAMLLLPLAGLITITAIKLRTRKTHNP